METYQEKALISIDTLSAIVFAAGALVCLSQIPTLCSRLCCGQRRRHQEIMDLLHEIKSDLATIKDAFPNVEFDTESQDSQQEQEEIQEQGQQEEHEEIQEEHAPLTAPAPDDKHALLRSKLVTGRELFVSYKRTTFIGTYELKPGAPHGYVIKHNNVEYLTPSQFSFKVKLSVNPAISSDNGWDTVYVITGNNDNGKPIKASLKTLINEA